MDNAERNSSKNESGGRMKLSDKIGSLDLSGCRVMKPGIYLKVVADSNDADYYTEIKQIDNATVDKFKPLIKAIAKFRPYKNKPVNSGFQQTHSHNWPKGEYCCREDLGEKTIHELYDKFDAELLDEFDENYVPHGYEGNIHTIESICVIEISAVTNLL